MPLTTRPLQGRRLLLVEDDYLLAGALAAALEDYGARVYGPVGTVDGAIALLADLDALDAVVLDANLDGQRVDPVADFARERTVPIVFVSGYDREFLPSRFADVPHCLKPVDIDELSNLLVTRVLS